MNNTACKRASVEQIKAGNGACTLVGYRLAVQNHKQETY